MMNKNGKYAEGFANNAKGSCSLVFEQFDDRNRYQRWYPHLLTDLAKSGLFSLHCIAECPRSLYSNWIKKWIGSALIHLE